MIKAYTVLAAIYSGGNSNCVIQLFGNSEELNVRKQLVGNPEKLDLGWLYKEQDKGDMK